ncbi:hypothetical protein [Oryzobacter terrae]|uniref:hypothetical protein n=1 Tax=Oryzobacter terrae TaxID=1620385 RepID=UPI00366FCAEB
MTTTVQDPRTRRRTDRYRAGLIAALAVVALSALGGGIGLATTGIGMPDSWLARLPVDSWVLPGLALVLTVALPQALTAGLLWRRHPLGDDVAVVAGVGLVLWILVQLAVMQQFFVLQPVVAAVGLAEVALAVALRRRGTPR